MYWQGFSVSWRCTEQALPCVCGRHMDVGKLYRTRDNFHLGISMVLPAINVYEHYFIFIAFRMII